MNKELLDYIRHLSKQDRKNLVEKALKTSQECGSLANVCLSYQGAYATNHKFIKREQVLEEAIDTVLCAMSTAYSLDFTDAEIEDMIALKSKKWQSLQAAEQDIVYPLPYEIHITVELDNDSYFETKFRTVCEEIGIKPVFIDNQFKSGEKVRDVLTSYTHYGNNASVYNIMRLASDILEGREFKVVRKKIETVPWHPAAPRTIEQPMPKDTYFEAHIGIEHASYEFIILDMCVRGYNECNCDTEQQHLHISNNPYKVNEDGTRVTYLTLRMYDATLDQFEERVQYALGCLNNGGMNWKVSKVHKEFAIYDSNVSHDAAWLKGE